MNYLLKLFNPTVYEQVADRLEIPVTVDPCPNQPPYHAVWEYYEGCVDMSELVVVDVELN